MSKIVLLTTFLLVAAGLAGCADDAVTPPVSGTPATTTPATSTPVTSTPATSTPATSTPATSTPPAGTTPASPTPPTPMGTVTRVVVLSAPERVEANATAEVCWRVEGTGEAPHVALHVDEESHPDATSFQAYAGGAVYPGNAATSPRVGLPAVLCANLTAPASGALYFRAHAMVPPALPGVLSEEKALRVGEAAGIQLVGDLPEVAPANATVTVCWRVEGATGTVPHTAVHFDTQSHPDADSFQAYTGGAAYPDNATSQSGNYTLPGPFCTDVRMPASGALYFRPHAMGGDHAPPGLLGEEEHVVVASRVNVVGPLPATAAAGSMVNVCWRVEGSGPTPHTAIHWDTESHPGSTAFSDYDGGAVYAGNGESAAQTLPGPFCADLTMPAAGALYFRAHGVFPGVGLPGELGEEHVIRVG